MAEAVLARSERFELPTLGIEIRCSIQLSYERVYCPITRLGGQSDVRPGHFQPCTPRSKSITRSEAGVASALSVVGCGTLNAKIVRRAVVISEGAGFRSRAIIVRVADRIRQPIGQYGPIANGGTGVLNRDS